MFFIMVLIEMDKTLNATFTAPMATRENFKKHYLEKYGKRTNTCSRLNYGNVTDDKYCLNINIY